MIDEILPGCGFVTMRNQMSDAGAFEVEGERDVPFAIARVYYLIDTPAGATRNAYAHRTLTEMATIVAGGCEVRLNDGHRCATVRMDSPSKGLLLPPLIWHEFTNFSAGCVAVVYASASADEEGGYLRDADDFKRAVAEASLVPRQD